MHNPISREGLRDMVKDGRWPMGSFAYLYGINSMCEVSLLIRTDKSYEHDTDI